MAVVTGVVTCNVAGGFAGRRYAVMTVETSTRHDVCVIEGRCRNPGNGKVAVVTRIGADNMVGRLAGCRYAIVAVKAGTGSHVGVIKSGRRCPGYG